jgi:hypothetical protein
VLGSLQGKERVEIKEMSKEQQPPPQENNESESVAYWLEKGIKEMIRRHPSAAGKNTTVGTCDFCHDTEVIVHQEIPEAVYRKFPELLTPLLHFYSIAANNAYIYSQTYDFCAYFLDEEQ